MQEWNVDTFFKHTKRVISTGTDFKYTCKVCGFQFNSHANMTNGEEDIDSHERAMQHIRSFHCSSVAGIPIVILPEGDHDSSECKHEFNAGGSHCIKCGMSLNNT